MLNLYAHMTPLHFGIAAFIMLLAILFGFYITFTQEASEQAERRRANQCSAMRRKFDGV